jgi:hypothetical protein
MPASRHLVMGSESTLARVFGPTPRFLNLQWSPSLKGLGCHRGAGNGESPLERGFHRIWTQLLGLVSGDALLLPGPVAPAGFSSKEVNTPSGPSSNTLAVNHPWSKPSFVMGILRSGRRSTSLEAVCQGRGTSSLRSCIAGHPEEPSTMETADCLRAPPEHQTSRWPGGSGAS